MPVAVILAILLCGAPGAAQSPHDVTSSGRSSSPSSRFVAGQPHGHHLSGQRSIGGSRPQPTLASIDTETRWEFRAKSAVTIPSTIIRLRDVVTPLNPSVPGWQRLQGTVIGLIPVTSDSVVIDRSRLATAIRKAEARPIAIDLIGPTKIKVLYRKGVVTTPSTVVDSHRQPLPTYRPPAAPPSLDERKAKIAVSFIYGAIKRQLPDVDAAFVSTIDIRAPELTPLASMRGQPTVTFLDVPADGVCHLRVVGANLDGPCQADVPVTLKANPTIVVARSRFPRGHRFRYEDLSTKPVPADEIEQGMISDPHELVGMELRRPVNSERPISRSDVGAPILIRRGDQLEIRVIGGAIMVATNGKAMEDGSERELISVEVSDSRKKILATVVQSGVVEVVSRTQRVGR